MAGYAIGLFDQVSFGPEVTEYLERIDATLAPHEGRFLVHGARHECLDGHWQGGIVVIEFPTLEAAKAWYHSDAYQAILPLRTRNVTGVALVVDGVAEPHRATDILRPADTAAGRA